MAWIRQHQRATGIGVTISALVLLLIAAALGWAMFTRQQPSTAGLGSSIEPSASLLHSPAAVATPTSEPTATTEPASGYEAPAGILPPSSRAVVIVDALQIRAGPGLNATVTDNLPAGTEIRVSGYWGPTVVDGIDWYRIVYYGDLGGYAAAGAGGDRYLELLPPRCPQGDPDLEALVRMTAWEWLACFGDQSLSMTGTFGCFACDAGTPGSYEPSWLASPENLNYLGIGGVTGLNPSQLILHFSPAVGLDAPPIASIVRVTGHFSDKASTTCVIQAPGEPFVPVDPVNAELWCREQFVVDAYQIIGSDPDFTYSSLPPDHG